MQMDEPQSREELLPVLESEEIVEAAHVLPPRELLAVRFGGLRYLLRKSKKMFQRRSLEESPRCKLRQKMLARNLLTL